MTEFDHIVAKVLDAANGGWGVQSTGEKLMAALVLSRHDWLDSMGYTIPQALDRVGASWVALVSMAAATVAEHERLATEAKTLARTYALLTADPSGGELDAAASLVAYNNVPGYRDATITVDLQPVGSQRRFRCRLQINAADSNELAVHLVATHRLAWLPGRRPSDAKENEQLPEWISL
ncbi:Uncharacterised protein [Bordetella ansorpii]|uniref:Half a barrel domain-containing protein n=1 Tax=Bordetella ansorpii TaxID=288768 RepID=A0A157SRA8_9BORD|nr:hypothetical protein [Bordetella ansorpii]SAI72962.1 Uncharacterised protein [Bordetella ansorpii]